MDSASDEVKLQLIKESLNELKMMIKMMMTTQTTIKSYSSYINGEVPEELLKNVNADEFKHVFSLAVDGNQEALNNLILAAQNISSVFNEDFIDTLPSNQEEFEQMTKQLQQETLDYQKKYKVTD